MYHLEILFFVKIYCDRLVYRILISSLHKMYHFLFLVFHYFGSQLYAKFSRRFPFLSNIFVTIVVE